jgi:hypothetical protein
VLESSKAMPARPYDKEKKRKKTLGW